MTKPDSTKQFDRNAYVYCPNVSRGSEGRHHKLGLSQADITSRVILDVGCGYMASGLSSGPRIYRIYPNLGIVRYEGEDMGRCPVQNKGKSLRALAEELPFADDTFDIAYSMKGVGWYPQSINFEMAVREMLRIVKKETCVAVFNIGQDMTDEIVNGLLFKLYDEGYRSNINGRVCALVNPQFNPPPE